ncbi:MAG: AraC family transcriptional regulator [Capsulimonadaceae bacterium]|nr:AraC family transcriptional regulator [Capsulimonadaceae bacterium]
MPRTLSHEGYVGAQCLVDELRMAGHSRLNRPQANSLRPHMHHAAFEICYIADGMANWWVEDGTYEVRGGQFFVTKPAELHGGVNSSASPAELYWAQVVIPDRGAFPGLSEAETERMHEGLWNIRDHVFHASTDPSPLFDRLLDCLQSETEFRMLSLRIALHELLLRVLADAPPADNQGRACLSEGSPHVARALSWIDEHLADEFSVDDIAAACGIAVSYLHKLFADEMGVTPGEYRTGARISRAKRRLKDDAQSITAIALDLGFSSSQYFATAFKARTGMTPRQYRIWSRQDTPPCRVPAYVD